MSNLPLDALNSWANRDFTMRRWYVPLTVLGLGGISALLLTEQGRSILRKMAERLWLAPDRLQEWNDNLQTELDRIQRALDQIADTIDPRPEMGH
jgi:hypothetical protein